MGGVLSLGCTCAGGTNGTGIGKSDNDDILAVLVLPLNACAPLEMRTLRASLPLGRAKDRPAGYTFGTLDLCSSIPIPILPDRPGTVVGEGGNT
jgi:hypothetical protein